MKELQSKCYLLKNILTTTRQMSVSSYKDAQKIKNSLDEALYFADGIYRLTRERGRNVKLEE